MRLIVWLIWCAVLGAMLSAFGINVVDNTIWFFLVDGAFLMASWTAFNMIWPVRTNNQDQE